MKRIITTLAALLVAGCAAKQPELKVPEILEEPEPVEEPEMSLADVIYFSNPECDACTDADELLQWIKDNFGNEVDIQEHCVPLKGSPYCTQEQPWATINRAMYEVNSIPTIIVRPTGADYFAIVNSKETFECLMYNMDNWNVCCDECEE